MLCVLGLRIQNKPCKTQPLFKGASQAKLRRNGTHVVSELCAEEPKTHSTCSCLFQEVLASPQRFSSIAPTSYDLNARDRACWASGACKVHASCSLNFLKWVKGIEAFLWGTAVEVIKGIPGVFTNYGSCRGMIA